MHVSNIFSLPFKPETIINVRLGPAVVKHDTSTSTAIMALDIVGSQRAGSSHGLVSVKSVARCLFCDRSGRRHYVFRGLVEHVASVSLVEWLFKGLACLPFVPNMSTRHPRT